MEKQQTQNPTLGESVSTPKPVARSTIKHSALGIESYDSAALAPKSSVLSATPNLAVFKANINKEID